MAQTALKIDPATSVVLIEDFQQRTINNVAPEPEAIVVADPEVHRVLTEKVYPRQGAVVSADEFLAALR